MSIRLSFKYDVWCSVYCWMFNTRSPCLLRGLTVWTSGFESYPGQLPLIVNRRLRSVSSEGKINEFPCHRMTSGEGDSTEAAEGRMGHQETKGPLGKLTMRSPVFWFLVGGQRGSIIYFCHILPPTQFLLSLQEIYNYNGNKHIGTYNQNVQILGERCWIYQDKNFKTISSFCLI